MRLHPPSPQKRIPTEPHGSDRGVRKILSDTAKQHFYYNDCHKATNHCHPEWKCRRQVKSEQHTGNDCAAIRNGIGLLGDNVIQIFKNDTEATQTQINMSARKPNSKVAAMAVGISATTTVSIMLEVVTGSFRCGEVTTKSLFFNVIHLLLFLSTSACPFCCKAPDNG